MSIYTKLTYIHPRSGTILEVELEPERVTTIRDLKREEMEQEVKFIVADIMRTDWSGFNKATVKDLINKFTDRLIAVKKGQKCQEQ